MPVGTVILIVLVIAVLVLVFSGVAARMGMTPSGAERRELRQTRERLTQAEELIDHLRETAYQHRELDSTLSTIITDDIAQYYSKRRRELER